MIAWIKAQWNGWRDLWHIDFPARRPGYNPPPAFDVKRPKPTPVAPKGGTGASRAPGVFTSEEVAAFIQGWNAPPVTPLPARLMAPPGYWRHCGPAGEQEWVPPEWVELYARAQTLPNAPRGKREAKSETLTLWHDGRLAIKTMRRSPDGCLSRTIRLADL